MVRTVFATIGLGAAYLVMASIFEPDRTEAQPGGRAVDRSRPGAPADVTTEDDAPSTDAHHGLRSLGSLETGTYRVSIYSTGVGPRYSVYRRADDALLATLRTAEQIAAEFPDLPLSTIDFDAPVASGGTGDGRGPVMQVDPLSAFGDD
jgi:hypothetical protein